ncbi:MAG: FAD-binding oxidoreductase [Hyphomicrobiaceae bacterium]
MSLAQALGPQAVVTAERGLQAFVFGGAVADDGCVAAILPRSVEEVDLAVALCAQHGTPIVGRGHATSLAPLSLGPFANTDRGGEAPPFVILSTQRLTSQCRVDEANGLVIADAGVTLARLHAAAARAGLAPRLAFEAETIMTIGGAIASGALGIGAWGRELIIAACHDVEVVTAALGRTGWAVTGAEAGLVAPSPSHVWRAGIGQGAGAIITRASFPLQARSEAEETLVYRHGSVEPAIEAFRFSGAATVAGLDRLAWDVIDARTAAYACAREPALVEFAGAVQEGGAVTVVRLAGRSDEVADAVAAFGTALVGFGAQTLHDVKSARRRPSNREALGERSARAGQALAAAIYLLPSGARPRFAALFDAPPDAMSAVVGALAATALPAGLFAGFRAGLCESKILVALGTTHALARRGGQPRLDDLAEAIRELHARLGDCGAVATSGVGSGEAGDGAQAEIEDMVRRACSEPFSALNPGVPGTRNDTSRAALGQFADRGRLRRPWEGA